jgi:opine dehydrogenase
LLEASLFSAAMGRNLVGDNDLLSDLALDKLSPTALIALCEEWPSA